MATIQEFILRFKAEGTNNLKALKDDIRDLTNSANPLNSSLGNLAGRMGPLAAGAAAAAGAFAVLGMRAMDLGDQLDDISNATGIAAGQLVNLRSSLINAGGDADSFSKFASKLSIAVGESASGNEKYQKSFKDLGVFITDAGGKVRDTGDILEDVLAGLANTDPAIRQAKAVEILGKEAAKIDWSNVRAGRDIEFDAASKNLAHLRGQIDALKVSIDEGLLRAFGNLAKAINEGGISGGIAKITESLGNLVAEILNLPTDAIAGVLNLFGVGIKDPVGLGSPLKALVERAKKEREQYQAEMKKSAEAKAAADKALQGARPGPANVPGGGFGATPEATLKAIEESRNRIAQSGIEARKQAELRNADEISKIQIGAQYEIERATAEINAKERLNRAQKDAEIAAKRVEIENRAAVDIAAVREKQGQQLRQIEGINAAYRNQLDLQRGSINLQTMMVGKTEEERAVAESLGKLQADYRAKDLELRLRLESLGKNELYQAEALKEQRKKLIESRDEEEQLLKESVVELQKALRLEEGRKTLQQQRTDYQSQTNTLLGYEASELDKINALIAQQPDKYKEVGDQLRANASLQDQNLRFLKEFNSQQERSKRLSKEGFDIGLAYSLTSQDLVREQSRSLELMKARNSAERLAINEQFDREERLSRFAASRLTDEIKIATALDIQGDATAEQVQTLLDYYSLLQQQKTLEESLSSIRLYNATQLADMQNTFAYGWDEAFKAYAESAFNAGQQARDSFSTFTDGMEDAFVRFVQTGKLSFKDMAQSILADLTRIAVKRAIVFAATRLFGIPMLADGGPASANQPYIVGEEGPELFVPKSSGTVIPNDALTSGGRGVGFGPTVVNYNIEAVDAASFRQLVARDPSFIYAVTEQGRRSQPTRSR